ncbi:ABC transporter permease [Acidisoma cellulosilytica]|uniref:ABC transporter permease n=1 Tax=Acidisoma cellulosilyticum TaxID=2802395 RepID=A0A963Z3U3_9PROT|nr:ABC transporter permease [Acidisoma cellulosilyticum]MCB8882021.1 ABC transporter permease [Acidisoma cellulosilyticum]
MSSDTVIETAPPRTRARMETPGRRIWRATYQQFEFKLGLFLLVVLVGAALIYPHMTKLSPTRMHIMQRFWPPVFLPGGHWSHLLGTDQLGRDLFLRSLIGLQNALMISVSAVIIMFVVGAIVGLLAGFYGGIIDTVLMRITDAQLAVPVIILAITILTVHRPSPESVTLVLALSGWPGYARVVRSVTLAERQREYVRGAKILGASPIRIMLQMIAPNVLPPIAFVAVLDIARMMIFEAILGFIGIGVQPPTPTFGNIIADGRQYLINAWWISTMPGAFLFTTLLGINLVGSSIERARNKVLEGRI